MQDQNTYGDNGEIVTLKQISLQNKLLFGLKNVQDRFYLGKCPKDLFVELLQLAMSVTDSPEGCIAELVTDARTPQLEILADSGHIDEPLRAMLTAHLLQDEDVIIFNAGEKHNGEIRSFIGLPASLGDNLIGLICLANRKGGYDAAMVDFLEPMQTTFNSLLIFRRLHSEKLHAEGRQQELNNHLNELLKSVDDIIFEINARKVFLDVWVRDESLLFMPKERFLGKTVREVMGPLADQMDALVDKVIASGETAEVDYAHIDPSIGLRFNAKVSL
ncbi:MAG: hypothetical protein KDC07_10240, partial [Chitinophagaceae bacterium]|nr:hypothetical protein [Chitinophagaceae bacterium]